MDKWVSKLYRFTAGVKEMLMRPERQLGTQYVSTYLLLSYGCMAASSNH